MRDRSVDSALCTRLKRLATLHDRRDPERLLPTIEHLEHLLALDDAGDPRPPTGRPQPPPDDE